jgi:hypothetical protein
MHTRTVLVVAWLVIIACPLVVAGRVSHAMSGGSAGDPPAPAMLSYGSAAPTPAPMPVPTRTVIVTVTQTARPGS